MKRSHMAAIAAPVLLAGGLLGSGVMAQDATLQYSADLQTLNDSGASGTATLSLDGDMLTVTIEATGLSPDLPHAQHIHGALDGTNSCPPPTADTDDDGFISVAEGAPFYGGILISLTTTGGTDAGGGLALDRMPVADAAGNLSYSREFAVSSEIAENLANLHIVQHGIDLDSSGAYDGDKPSSIDPDVPFEATVPATCGGIDLLDTSTTTTAAPTTPAPTQPAPTQPAPAQPAPTAPSGQLPATGTTTDIGVLAAVALLFGGAALVGFTRRRVDA